MTTHTRTDNDNDECGDEGVDGDEDTVTHQQAKGKTKKVQQNKNTLQYEHVDEDVKHSQSANNSEAYDEDAEQTKHM